MAEFVSAYDYERFEKSVYRKARFVHDDETRQFLSTVMETSKSRVVEIPKNSKLCRAQLGSTPRMEYPGTDHEFEVPGAHSPERMQCRRIRPWVGAEISLAQFIVLRDCRVVDCSRDKRRSLNFSLRGKKPEFNAEQKEAEVWGEIAYAFSKPVVPREPIADYIATQILAEAFRARGFDGVVYKSGLAKGHNVALSDIDLANLMMCGLQETKDVKYEFDQADNPYYIIKYYPDIAKSIEKQDRVDEEAGDDKAKSK